MPKPTKIENPGDVPQCCIVCGELVWGLKLEEHYVKKHQTTPLPERRKKQKPEKPEPMFDLTQYE